MHRIDSTTAVEDLNGPGKNGFTEGDPGIPLSPTKVTAKILNALQEELCNIVEAAGLTLDDEDNTQVLQAIMSLLIGRNRCDGFIVANNSGDIAHDIDVGVGFASDTTNAYIISSAASMTKRIDAVWAAGTNQGGFPSGGGLLTLSNDTWYRVFVIGKSTDSTAFDIGFDTSATAANLLHADNAGGSGFDIYRRVGWVRYMTGALLKFYQKGEEIVLDEVYNDLSIGSIAATTAQLQTVLCPPDADILGRFVVMIGGYNPALVLVTSVFQNDIAPSDTQNHFETNSTDEETMEMQRYVDANSQIRYRVNNTSMRINIRTMGWTDRRGKN